MIWQRIQTDQKKNGLPSNTTWNPADSTSYLTFEQGYLSVFHTSPSSVWRGVRATNPITDKAYWEVIGSIYIYWSCGIGTFSHSLNQSIGITVAGYGVLGSTGAKYHVSAASYGSAFESGDVMQIAVNIEDGQNGQIWWGKNGVWFGAGDPKEGLNPGYTGISGAEEWWPILAIYSTSRTIANFGPNFRYQNPWR